MQRITVIGNIGKDAVIKNHNGNDFITFSVAVNEKYKNTDGVEVEKTQWYNCLFQPQKMTIAQYLKRGGKVFVEGKPKVSMYRDKDNQPAIDFGIQVRNVELLSTVDSGNSTANQTTKQPENSASPLESISAGNSSEDDLPF